MKSIASCLQVPFNVHPRDQISNLDGVKYLPDEYLVPAQLVEYFSTESGHLDVRGEAIDLNECREKPVSDHLRSGIL